MKEEYTYQEIVRHNPINCSSVLLKTEVAKAFPMHHDDSHEDYLMWLEILEKYGKGCAVNEPLLKYRISNQRKSGNKWNSAKMTFLTYRYMGFGMVRSVAYFICYAFHGVRKYFLWFLKCGARDPRLIPFRKESIVNGFYWIYLVMIAFLLGYHFAGTREQKRLIFYAACGFLILIFVAQDFSVSIDIAEYMRQWEIIPNLSLGQMLVHKFEIGYVLLCWVLERVFTSERVLLLVLSVMIMIPFCRYFETQTQNPMIALMAFVALGMYLHAVIFWRQLVAMAILTFSYRFIRERRFWPFLLTVLAAMTFHKVSVVFLGLYVIYRIPINKWLLLGCALCGIVLGICGRPIIEFGISVIYPRYENFPRLVIGGETLLALLWVVVLLSYWLLHDRLHEDSVRLPFLMVLIAATIQPVCFAFYNWLRVVLFFRVALVPMTAHLYTALFEQKEGNWALALLERCTPRLHRTVLAVYDRQWFRIAAQLILFAVLFVWYVSELDGAVYIMAPIV